MVRPTPRAFPSEDVIRELYVTRKNFLACNVSRLTFLTDSGIHGFRPHLQRRDREGFAPSSLT
jgi:hypothetical protein